MPWFYRGGLKTLVKPLGSGDSICVCGGVFFPFILDVKFVRCTSRGHTGFFIHLPSALYAFIFLARRIQPFLSLVDREVELYVLTNQSFSTCWAFFFFF